MVHDSDGRNATKIQSYSAVYRQLVRCGPGRIAYWAADSKRKSHIARTDILTGATTALTEGPNDSEPTCNADGSTLVFLRSGEKRDHSSLMRKSLESGQTVPLYELNMATEGVNATTFASPRFSPDGKTVLFWTLDGGNPYEWAASIPIEGGQAKHFKMPFSAGEVGWFQWLPDGRSVLCERHQNGVGNIWSVPFDGKAPSRITNFESDHIFAADVSPDNRLVISRGRNTSDVVLIKNVK